MNKNEYASNEEGVKQSVDRCCSNASCCPQELFTRSNPNIGCNDPCLGGSGKKFKKCCAQFLG